jgi:hypothetical protein
VGINLRVFLGSLRAKRNFQIFLLDKSHMFIPSLFILLNTSPDANKHANIKIEHEIKPIISSNEEESEE